MRKIISVLLASIILLVTFSVTACQQVSDVDNHEHAFAAVWSTSETEHWHAATCEHTDVDADRTNHDFNVVVNREATVTEAGEAVYTCKVCNFTKTAALEYGNHEHIVGLVSNHNEHRQSYICCDSELSDAQHCAHDFNQSSICSDCGSYSVLDQARAKINNGLFAYTLVVEEVNIPLSMFVEGGSDIMISSGSFKLGLDENYMLTLVGMFTGSNSTKIEVAPDEYDTVVGYIDGKIVIENNKVYISYITDGGGRKYEKSSEGSECFNEINYPNEEKYQIYDINTQLLNVSAEEFNHIFNVVLDEVYGYSYKIKPVVDALFQIDCSGVFNTWFTLNEQGEYAINFGVINAFNNRAKDLTIGNILSALVGEEDYAAGVNQLVTNVLNTTVGNMLDFLQAQGVDIYEINELVNKYIAEYYPGEISTIEQLLASNGLPVPSGILVADFIDSKVVRAYKVIDLVNMLLKSQSTAEKYEDLTVDAILSMVGEIVANYGELNVYELIGNLLSSILEMEESLTANNVYTIIDELANFLADCVHVTAKIENGEMVKLALNISYEEPAATEEPTTTEESTEGNEPEVDPFNEQIKELFNMIRPIVSMCSVKLSLEKNAPQVNADQIIDTICNKVEAVRPDKATIVAALENEGLEDVEITQKDGRDYVSFCKNDFTEYAKIYKDDYTNWLYIYAKVRYGAYVDEMFTNVHYSDTCGEYYIVCYLLEFKPIEYLGVVRAYWREESASDLTPEELDAIRDEYDDKQGRLVYPLLFGTIEENYYTEIYLQNSQKDGLQVIDSYSNSIIAPTKNPLHKYELTAGETERVNDTYHTKHVYACKDCGKSVVLYVLDEAKPYTQTAE